ncbi:MAG: hypothetical protein Q6K90_04070 [Gloeomargarita sp. HHBFW_bins_162]
MMELWVMVFSMAVTTWLGQRFSVLGRQYSELHEEVGQLKERVQFLEVALRKAENEADIWRDKYLRGRE